MRQNLIIEICLIVESVYEVIIMNISANLLTSARAKFPLRKILWEINSGACIYKVQNGDRSLYFLSLCSVLIECGYDFFFFKRAVICIQ